MEFEEADSSLFSLQLKSTNLASLINQIEAIYNMLPCFVLGFPLPNLTQKTGNYVFSLETQLMQL